MSDELIHDVEEAVRQENIQKFWKENGSFIIGLCLAVILVTGGISLWRDWQTKTNEENTAAMVMALDTSDDNLLSSLEDVGYELKPDQRAIAKLIAAHRLIEEGDEKDAVKLFKDVAADQSISNFVGTYAILRAIHLDWNIGGIPAEEMLSYLQSFWGDSKNPWRFHARLLGAQIIAHELKDYERAHEHLKIVMNAVEAPMTLKTRAQALDHVYRIDYGEGK